MGREKERQIQEQDKRRDAYADGKFRETTFTNRYAGSCAECGRHVPAENGWWTKGRVLCAGCGDWITQDA